MMSYRNVVVLAAVVAASLLSVTLWPGALIEMVVTLVVLCILPSVALTYNLLSRTLTNGPQDQLAVEWLLRDAM